MDIYVTGMGLVTALGEGVDINHQKLKSGESGITDLRFVEAKTKKFLVGEFQSSTEDLAVKMDLKPSETYSRTGLLGLLASKQIDQGTQYHGLKSGFINGSTVGGMDRTEIYYQDSLIDNDHTKYANTSMHDLGTMTQFIASHLGEFHYVNTISTACSSAANAIMMGARMIQAGKLDRVIAGGCDSLSAFTINGFKSLMIYDKEQLKPLDNNRNGLNLGEGAGYIQLESTASIAKSGNKIIAKLSGWCNANDSYHQTATSPDGDGPRMAIEGALRKAHLKAQEISYINAHGTGTQNNDHSELTAIESVFENVPPFSSTKSFMGHTLGAAGGIEAVISIMSILNSAVYPTINWSTKMEGFRSQPCTLYDSSNPIHHVLSNSFGFGGNSSSLIFSKN